MTLATNPPWWVLLTLGPLVLAVAYAAYARLPVPLTPRQRTSLMALRAAVLGLLVLGLLRPVTTSSRTTSDGVVVVLVDASRSMGIRDDSGASGAERAATLVEEGIRPALDEAHEVDVLRFGEGIRPAPASGPGPVAGDRRTDVSGALDAVRARYAGRPLAGVVIVSDGGDTSGRDAGAAAAALGAPVYPLGVGADPGVDLEVASATPGRAAVAGTVIDIEAMVVARGLEGDLLEVRLVEDGQLLDVRRVTVEADGVPRPVVFQVTPGADVATLYTIEIPPVPGERVTENNRRRVLVPPPGRPRRLLMVEGAPGHDHSFLKRVWLGDVGVELDAVIGKGQNDLGERTFYIQADPGRAPALATGYPRDRTDLFRYDGVVLANVEASTLRPDQLAMTAELVERRGGGLLLLGSRSLTGAGLEGSPLEEMLPLELSGRRRVNTPGGAERVDTAIVTDDGLHHPVTRLGETPEATRDAWAGLPRLGGSVGLGPARPGASVLALVSAAGGGRRPLLAVQRYGRGRAMVFTGEAVWRWKMLRPAADEAFDRLWGQAVRWLTAAAEESLSVQLPTRALPGDRVEVEIRVRDDGHEPRADLLPTVRVTGPGGTRVGPTSRSVPEAPGVFSAGFVPERTGVYRVEAVVDGEEGQPTATSWLLVDETDETEWAAPGAQVGVLDRLAEASGGRRLAATDLSGLSATLDAGFAGVTRTVRHDAWHGAWTWLAVLGLLTVEWWTRRRWGLR